MIPSASATSGLSNTSTTSTPKCSPPTARAPTQAADAPTSTAHCQPPHTNATRPRPAPARPPRRSPAHLTQAPLSHQPRDAIPRPLSMRMSGAHRVKSGSTGRSRVRDREQLVEGSRQISEAGIARTEPVRVDPGAIRSPGVQASLGRDRLRSSPRVAIPIEVASRARRPVLCLGCHRVWCLPVPLGVHAEPNTARTRAINQIGTRQPRGWGNAGRTYRPFP